MNFTKKLSMKKSLTKLQYSVCITSLVGPSPGNKMWQIQCDRELIGVYIWNHMSEELQRKNIISIFIILITSQYGLKNDKSVFFRDQ